MFAAMRLVVNCNGSLFTPHTHSRSLYNRGINDSQGVLALDKWNEAFGKKRRGSDRILCWNLKLTIVF